MVYYFVMLTVKDSSSTLVRHASLSDLAAITEIYNYYVLNTSITFDLATFTPETRRPWFNQFDSDSPYQCLVLEIDQRVIGYASSAALRPKAAYNTSVECSIYLDSKVGGQGHGSRLYEQLFDRLNQHDLHRCYGIITLPNQASLALHRSFGFSEVARLNEVGRKFGRYWDTVWMEKSLGPVRSPD